jgi:hypothetical protein
VSDDEKPKQSKLSKRPAARAPLSNLGRVLFVAAQLARAEGVPVEPRHLSEARWLLTPQGEA